MDFVSSVIVAMADDLTPEQLQKLQDIMRLLLAKQEAEERRDEIAVSPDGWYSALKLFLATKKLSNCADSTLTQYDRALRLMMQIINKPLNEITTNDLRGYLAVYMEQRKISPAYLDTMRLYFSSFFGWLHAEGMISSNPASRLARVKVPEVIKEPYTATEMEMIRDNCKCPRDRALVEVLYSTAGRVGEVCAINRSDVDFEKREIKIYGQKGKRERVVYLTEEATYHLRKYLLTRKDLNPALFIGLKAPYNRITKSSVESMLSKIGAATGIHCHPHKFRRTMLTEQGRRGMPLQEIQAYAGHKKPETTMMYVVVSNESIRSSFRRLVG